MARLFICDDNRWITADIEASGSIFSDALDHEQAAPVVRCAILLALSALLEGGEWPTEVLQHMSAFMASMKAQVTSARLM
jgi:hypothetical protein